MRKRPILRAEPLDTRDCPAVFGNPWLDPNLTLSFAPDGTVVNGVPSRFDAALANIPEATRRSEVLRAFQTWIAAANVNIGVVADGGQAFGVPGVGSHDPRFGDVRIAATPLAIDDVALALPFDVSAGTRAGDLLFNSTQPFRAGTTGGYDLFSVALHEAGHIFGLAGSSDPTSAMYQIADRVRTGLNAADIQAIQQLYGPRQSDRYEGPNGNATIANAAQLQPTGSGGSNAIEITADITTADDVDVYSFKADHLEGGAYLVKLSTAGFSLLAATVEILDSKGSAIATGTTDTTLRLANLKEGDTYFARVRSANPTFAVGGYRMEFRPESEAHRDELENPEVGSDDTAQTATSLDRMPSLSGTRQNFFVASSLSTATDLDFHRIRSAQPSGSAGGVLTVSVVATGTNAMDPVVDIYDANQVLQATTVLVHDGGEYSVQLPNTQGNRDYFVAVRHAKGNAAIGNYSLGIDFGGSLVPLQNFGAGVLTAIAPANTNTLTVTSGQVLHVIFKLDPTATPAAARLSVFDAANAAIDSRLVNAGEVSSLNIFLKPGVYTLLVGGGATDGGAIPNIHYSILGLTLSDPIGSQAVLPGVTSPTPFVPPPPPPPVAVTPPRPATPTIPVTPQGPNILLIPPTDQPTSPTLRLRPVSPPPAKTFSVGAANPNGSVIRSFNPDGTLRFTIVPIPGYTGTLRTAEADVNNDGIADILAGTGPGAASQVKLIDGKTQTELFSMNPFESTFTGGVFVSSGDVTGDGIADIIISPDQGGGPRVRVFNGVGFTPVMDFFGIDDANFRGGARTTVGDINADGTGDLIVAAGFAGGPRIAAFDGAALATGNLVHVFGDFFAFEQTLRNGVYIASGDIDGDGFADVIVGGGPSGGPRVLALSGKDLLTNTYTVKANFFGGDVANRDGIRVAVKNLDNDGRADLVVGVGRRVIGYSGVDIPPSGTPTAILDYEVSSTLTEGVFVG